MNGHIIILTFLSLFLFTEISCQEDEVTAKCTYFGGRGVDYSQHLGNCTWYAKQTCCFRTEEQSVLDSMYPLYGASVDCTNKMRFLMCYFCSPDQHRWYKRTLMVCASFCQMVYDSCKTAQFGGHAIGERYESGEQFCIGQNFQVIEGKGNCFEFDPTPFAAASTNQIAMLMLLTCTIISLTFIL